MAQVTTYEVEGSLKVLGAIVGIDLTVTVTDHSLPSDPELEDISEFFGQDEEELPIGGRFSEPSKNGHGSVDLGVPIQSMDCMGRKIRVAGKPIPNGDLRALMTISRVQSRMDATAPLRIITVGCWLGETAIAMQAGFGDQGGTVFCIDNFEGNQNDESLKAHQIGGSDQVRELFIDNCGDLIDKDIKLIDGDVSDLSKDLDPQNADIILIDTEKDYVSVSDEIARWLPHLGPRGCMVGRCYDEDSPGVVQAVNAMIGGGVDVSFFEQSSVWMVRAEQIREVTRGNAEGD